MMMAFDARAWVQAICSPMFEDPPMVAFDVFRVFCFRTCQDNLAHEARHPHVPRVRRLQKTALDEYLDIGASHAVGGT